MLMPLTNTTASSWVMVMQKPIANKDNTSISKQAQRIIWWSMKPITKPPWIEHEKKNNFRLIIAISHHFSKPYDLQRTEPKTLPNDRAGMVKVIFSIVVPTSNWRSRMAGPKTEQLNPSAMKANVNVTLFHVRKRLDLICSKKPIMNSKWNLPYESGQESAKQSKADQLWIFFKIIIYFFKYFLSSSSNSNDLACASKSILTVKWKKRILYVCFLWKSVDIESRKDDQLQIVAKLVNERDIQSMALIAKSVDLFQLKPNQSADYFCQCCRTCCVLNVERWHQIERISRSKTRSKQRWSLCRTRPRIDSVALFSTWFANKNLNTGSGNAKSNCYSSTFSNKQTWMDDQKSVDSGHSSKVITDEFWKRLIRLVSEARIWVSFYMWRLLCSRFGSGWADSFDRKDYSKAVNV